MFTILNPAHHKAVESVGNIYRRMREMIEKEMTTNIPRISRSIAVFALVLVSTSGATWAASGSAAAPNLAAAAILADAPIPTSCTDWEDWNHIRWFGLWSDKYHLPSSPNFNPHEESRWWRPETILWAGEPWHGFSEGYTVPHGHDLCSPS